jgi:Na+/H+ antiporter NhaD/arsenite permease-like protein
MESSMPIYALIPFVLMLLSIALLPLFAEHWWEHNKNKLMISGILGIPTMIWLFTRSMGVELEHTLIGEYIPFIILLGSLFVATGGIYVDGDIESKPTINAFILLIGAVLASFIGTTGAAMLLIRPLISSNKERKFKAHTILFFIAIVANCGGLLTPLGDPPLFLMYLKGVPFEWFFTLTTRWLVANGILLIVYYFVDTYFWKKETPEARYFDKTNVRPMKIEGKINFIYLLGIVLAVAFINDKTFPIIKEMPVLAHLRDLAMVIMALLSLISTKKVVRTKNNFTWGPIVEVAFLFIGIFITMIPALTYLRQNAASFGLTAPWQIYYSTGLLSGFLDNAPTALTFYNVALGLQAGSAATGAGFVAGIPQIMMQAICTGAVLWGSLSYIGNGPNFMVKAIAESQGVKMPDFLAYMYKFSIPVLVPIFVIIQLIFYYM